MGEAAVKVAVGCDYVNAGTVEFLYEDGEFYYLEMNTRLQVEHPVTEAVTGVDLVEMQIRVASGEALTITQDDVTITGHAIEIRINAEDPTGGAFLPSPGPLTALKTPDGFGVRFDTGYEAGDEISPFYDNLVGKLICWGPSREAAIARTLRALDELVVEGVATTIPADVAIVGHADFAAVTHSTKWVENVLDLSDISSGASGEVGPPDKVRRQTEVEVNGKRFDVAMWVPAPSGSGRSRPRRSSGTSGAGGGAGSGQVTVPMQGTIVKIMVEVGDEVEAGQSVIVLEAMKMENNVNADKAGIVSEIKVAPGDTVGGGDVVLVIE